MSGPLLMTFNAGSSSVKIGLFSIVGETLKRIAHALIDFRHSPLTFHLVEGKTVFDVELKADHADHLTDVMAETLDWISEHYDLSELTCVGHRVVHGGDEFDGPVLIDDTSLTHIEALSILAPLHQPQALRLIRAMRQVRPELTQVASFDTVFHRTNPDLIRRFALPRALHDRGIKRYGFHGLSYKFIAAELRRRFPEIASGRVVAAHLGSGASLCAMLDGKSQDTSMGFSTLDGVPMATRCGALDAGVILHLLQQEHRPVEEVEDMLYHQSGLKGVSGGISADCRELQASDDPHAKEALDLFTLRIAGEIGRLSMSIGGLDALVFTAGIGENDAAIRTAVAGHLGWMGLTLSEDANQKNAPCISTPESRVKAFVIPTNEERVIADEAFAVSNGKSGA
ncbi:acetate/propionate family kinase [Hyphomonas jannaschiana]|uniref:Acetate kinase n=1 Tax=Hyphomonas jannaschiana VP2 TaxID=1280952 RepID=A0A059F6U8_9PROT|nr:acetate/propionate family kinase [Hyphomonas jannaschiana]KCZ83992.1 acetate kinase [Hyphomonas jannaschiana VP2]